MAGQPMVGPVATHVPLTSELAPHFDCTSQNCPAAHEMPANPPHVTTVLLVPVIPPLPPEPPRPVTPPVPMRPPEPGAPPSMYEPPLPVVPVRPAVPELPPVAGRPPVPGVPPVPPAHAPLLALSTPASPRKQSLLYVFPSQPQTGITMAGQNWGFASHLPV